MKRLILLSLVVLLSATLVPLALAKDKKIDWDKNIRDLEAGRKYRETVLNPALEGFRDRLLQDYKLSDKPMFEDVEITKPNWITLWVKAEDVSHFDPAFVSWSELKETTPDLYTWLKANPGYVVRDMSSKLPLSRTKKVDDFFNWLKSHLANEYEKYVGHALRSDPKLEELKKDLNSKYPVWFKFKARNVTELYKALFAEEIKKDFHKDYLICNQRGTARKIKIEVTL